METVDSVLDIAKRQSSSSSTCAKDVISKPNFDGDNVIDTNTDGDVLKSINDSMGLHTGCIIEPSTTGDIEKGTGTIGLSTDSAISTGGNAVTDQNVSNANCTSSDLAVDKSIDNTDGSGIVANKNISSDVVVNEINNVAGDSNNNAIAIDTNTDAAVGTSIDSAIVSKSDASADLNVNPPVDTMFNGIAGSSMAPADSSINSTMKKSTNGDIVPSEDVFDKKKEFADNKDLNAAIETIHDRDMNCSPGAASDTKTNDGIIESTINSEENEALDGLKCQLSTGNKVAEKSADLVHPSMSKDADYQYDSEIEIIGCTSGKLEDKPATESTAINNQNPEFVVDVSDDTSLDTTTGNADNQGHCENIRGSHRRPRIKKRETYERRCRNMRQYKMKLKSSDVSQPTKQKSKTSLCLDKLTQNNMKFMENFDPKRSNRERRKLLRKTNGKRNLRSELYGLNGALISSGKNLCDCMNPHCPGCHFPCPRCQSPKCGHECRVNRKWTYEEIEIDGTDTVIKPQELIDSFSIKI